MTMRRGRLSLVVLGGLLGAIAVALFMVYLGLPTIVKWVAIHQGRTLLGRDVSIDRVELDAWRGWYRLYALRIAGRDGEPPLLEIAEADLRILYGFLLKGQLRASEFALTSPTLRVARTGPGQLSISDIIERFAAEDKEKPAIDKKPLEILADLIVVSNGAILLEDRAVSPPRAFDITNLSVNLRDISTKRDTGRGTGTVAFVLNGTPMVLTAEDIRVRPAHVKAQLNIVDLDLDLIWPYLPPDLPVRPDWGRFSAHVALLYDAAAGFRTDADLTMADLTLMQAGAAEPLASLPDFVVNVRELVVKGDTVTAGRLALATDISIVDPTLSPPRSYEVRDVRLVVQNVTYPQGPPANLTLTMSLPAGATLDLRGTVVPEPLAANLTVTLGNVDLTLANPYIPPVSPITIARGQLDANLTVKVAEGPSLRVNGELASTYDLFRRGQAEPFVIHPKVRTTITDLTWQAGQFALGRLTMDGPATVVDASVSPPQRAEFTTLTLLAEDATWPVQRPVRVKSSMAVAGSGRADVEGTFNPATLAADIRAKFADIDVTRAGPYIPPTVPVTVTGGRLAGTLDLKNDQAAGLTINTEAAVADFGVAHRGEPKVSVTDRRLGLTVADLRVQGSALSLRRAALTGAPSVAEEGTAPPRRVDLRSLRATARDVTWPAKRPVAIELVAELPLAGTLTVNGSATLDTRAVTAKLDLKNAALAPYQPLLPFGAPIAGEAGAAIAITASTGDTVTATVKGQAEVRRFTLGPPDRPVVSVEHLEAHGIDVQWPGEIKIDRAKLVKPVALVEREKDGSFLLRAMLAPHNQAAEGPASPAPTPPPAQPVGEPAGSPPPIAVTIREILVEDGTFRFVDRSTTPLYSEEMTKVAVKVTGLTSALDQRASIAVQAVVGATGALNLTGEVAPAATPFYLDLQGELHQFALPRTNPYFRQVFDYFLKQGSITNTIHYRIVGSELTADNQIKIQRLSVARDTSPIESDRKIGLPLGLIVAMVTDSRGNIEFDLPVSGDLTKPGFSLGGAIWAALKNVLVNMVTGPFRAIGKLFSKDDEVAEFKMDPVTFAPGTANVSAEGSQHLHRVADFLRAAPNLRLALHPVVSAEDLASLKTGEVTASIQRLQRAEKLDDFHAAAAKLFVQTFPGQPVPDTLEKIVERLREQAPDPDKAARELAGRRLEATRQALVQGGGIDSGRLTSTGERPERQGEGRVEFEILTGES
ncbi:MAG: DUF748 domain-containing protein [Candidatus Rokuibacteriota bacterium]